MMMMMMMVVAALVGSDGRVELWVASLIYVVPPDSPDWSQMEPPIRSQYRVYHPFRRTCDLT